MFLIVIQLSGEVEKINKKWILIIRMKEFF
jgi:hypothetical protein